MLFFVVCCALLRLGVVCCLHLFAAVCCCLFCFGVLRCCCGLSCGVCCSLFVVRRMPWVVVGGLLFAGCSSLRVVRSSVFAAVC